MTEAIRVIIFQEGEALWVAQGLERDICVQGRSVGEVQELFDVAATLESKERGGIERIDPAPEVFFKMWDNRSGGFEPLTPKAHDSIEFGIAA